MRMSVITIANIAGKTSGPLQPPPPIPPKLAPRQSASSSSTKSSPKQAPTYFSVTTGASSSQLRKIKGAASKATVGAINKPFPVTTKIKALPSSPLKQPSTLLTSTGNAGTVEHFRLTRQFKFELLVNARSGCAGKRKRQEVALKTAVIPNAKRNKAEASTLLRGMLLGVEASHLVLPKSSGATFVVFRYCFSIIWPKSLFFGAGCASTPCQSLPF